MTQRCIACFTQIDSGASACPSCQYDQSDPQRPPHALPARHTLPGGYQIGKVIGQGGFGITYLAYHEKLDSLFVIKEYFPSDLVGRPPGQTTVTLQQRNDAEVYKDFLNRFCVEAQILAKLEHPGIVSIKTYFEDNDTAYFVMELLSGQPLSSEITEVGRYPSEKAAQRMLRVLDALRAAHNHEARIVHRDIKPDNIFITSAGRVKLLDFGIARIAAGKDNESSQSNRTAIVGTPSYAAPEQMTSDDATKIGPWTDVYGCGTTLYHMLTGRKPQPYNIRYANNDGGQLNWDGCDDVPHAMRDLVFDAMRLNVAERVQSTEQFIERLRPLSGEVIASQRQAWPKWMVASVAGGTFGIAALAAWALVSAKGGDLSDELLVAYAAPKGAAVEYKSAAEKIVADAAKQNPKLKFKLVNEEISSDPAAAAADLIGHKVHAVIVAGWRSTSTPFAGALDQAGIPTIIVSSAPGEVAPSGRSLFTTQLPTGLEARELARAIKTQLDPRVRLTLIRDVQLSPRQEKLLRELKDEAHAIGLDDRTIERGSPLGETDAVAVFGSLAYAGEVTQKIGAHFGGMPVWVDSEACGKAPQAYCMNVDSTGGDGVRLAGKAIEAVIAGTVKAGGGHAGTIRTALQSDMFSGMDNSVKALPVKFFQGGSAVTIRPLTANLAGESAELEKLRKRIGQ